MNELMKIVHPGETHYLSFEKGSLPLSQTCHKCTQPVSREYYKCIRNVKGCEYYLHKECAELKDLPQKHHPLHPQHPLAIHSYFPHDKSFVCSFCGKTKQARGRLVYQCSEEQCDFYLDDFCETYFINLSKPLNKYEIQHVFHDHENHWLSPSNLIMIRKDYFSLWDDAEGDEINGYSIFRCAGCRYPIQKIDGIYRCNECDFFLHTECSQVPKQVVDHCSHPQHPLVLHHNQPAANRIYCIDDQMRCIACLKWMENEFYLHCTNCPTFNLDLQCYFRFQTKPAVNHEAHEHPLVYFSEIYDNDVRCYACNTPCKYRSFRCFTCNFNIHTGCLALPITVNYDDHVHPLTLTTSFKEDEHPTTYYCDICEKRRDPDHGIYLCKECLFMAHFECALSLSWKQKQMHPGVKKLKKTITYQRRKKI
ncbi:uncharacterized protein LOC107435452 isoform X2 [Ziziphus jujuba]|uniref:Uncharacterized protein LOC107435452 isoform X2 n=1 Tax=Ziziphus jujuba TaxID=326968 RepID=A0ABM3ZYX7_ZIZJJ|nr:uncharacterized protein LOC107435452 isoform X2 [Ziziphus jujuba]